MDPRNPYIDPWEPLPQSVPQENVPEWMMNEPPPIPPMPTSPAITSNTPPWAQGSGVTVPVERQPTGNTLGQGDIAFSRQQGLQETPYPSISPTMQLKSSSWSSSRPNMPSSERNDILGNVSRGQVLQEQAAEQSTADREKAFRDIQSINEEKARQERASYSDFVIKRLLHERRLDEAMAQVDADVGELTKSKIDTSGRFSVGQKIGFILGATLSEVGRGLLSISGRNPGNNTTLQIIEKAIDRDIQAQIAELANKKTAIQLKQNNIARLMQKGYSIENAYKLEKLSDLEVAKAKAESIMAGLQADTAKYNAWQTIGQISLQAANLKGDLATKLYGQTVSGGGKQDVLNPSARPGAIPGEAKINEKFRDTIIAYNMLQKAKKTMNRVKPWNIQNKIGEKSNEWDTDIASFVINRIYQMSGKQINMEEYKRDSELYNAQVGLGNLSGLRESAYKYKLNGAEKQLKMELDMLLKANPKLVNQLPPMLMNKSMTPEEIKKQAGK